MNNIICFAFYLIYITKYSKNTTQILLFVARIIQTLILNIFLRIRINV